MVAAAWATGGRHGPVTGGNWAATEGGSDLAVREGKGEGEGACSVRPLGWPTTATAANASVRWLAGEGDEQRGETGGEFGDFGGLNCLVCLVFF